MGVFIQQLGALHSSNILQARRPREDSTREVEALTPAVQQGMENESTDGAGDQADHENVDAVQEICGRDSRAHQVDQNDNSRGQECERVPHVPDQVTTL